MMEMVISHTPSLLPHRESPGLIIKLDCREWWR